ncbi:glycine-rich protein-like [Diaphorina citri]|uniref:Glycine-rich protein-like n=1 Tax=Diaphorina citri TaxID=121845 RepID=A0A1S4E7A1_DIACI|nr:glycine-rich protein-like [Diaphorina citri]
MSPKNLWSLIVGLMVTLYALAEAEDVKQSVTATTLGSPLRSFLIGAAVGGLGYAAYKGLKKAYKCGKYGCPPDYGYGGYGMGGMGGYGMGGMGGYGNGRYF